MVSRKVILPAVISMSTVAVLAAGASTAVVEVLAAMVAGIAEQTRVGQ